MNRLNKTRVFKIIIGGSIILFLLNSKFPYIHMHKTKTKITKQIKEDDNRNKDVKKPLTYVIKGKEISRDEVNKPAESQIQWINIEVTYYSNTYKSCGKTDGISANGTNLLKHTLSRGSSNYYIPVAMPKDIPFGTKVYVKGLGNVICVDRGGAIRWKNGAMKIDVFIPNASEQYLNKLGKKITKGYIIK